METNFNIKDDLLQHLIDIDAPMREIDFQGKCIGSLIEQFPKKTGNVFQTGDIFVQDGDKGWLRIYQSLDRTPFSDRYIAVYMEYNDCVKYGVINFETPDVRRFNHSFNDKLQVANTTEDYLSLIRWVIDESYGQEKEYNVYDKYVEIIKRNKESVQRFIKENDSFDSFVLKTILEEIETKFI